MAGTKTQGQKYRDSQYAMRFLFVTFAFLLVLPFGVSSQRVKLNKGKPASRKYLSSVNYQEVRGKIIMPVVIEGETYSFLFDSGAPNLITKELSEKISSKRMNLINVRDANDSSRKLEVISIPSILMGSAEFIDTPTIVNDPDSNFILDCFGVDGIIGSNMVRKTVVHIDSKNKILSLSNDPKAFNLEGLEGIELSLSDGQSSPYMWIGLKGEGKASEYVLFDTGMQGFYDMSIDNYDKLKELGAFSESESGRGTKSIGLFNNSETRTHYRVNIPQIDIGSHDFRNVSSVTMSADRSRIGSEILKYGTVTIDYKNSRLYFEPFEKERDLSEKELGFSPTIRDGEVVVGIVWSEELPDNLNYGDKILSINGKKIAGEDPCEFVSQPSPFESDEVFQIRFLDEETREEFELEMRKE